MMELPELFVFRGDWESYCKNLFQLFVRDFYETQPLFWKKIVKVRHYPMIEGKGFSFWHLISEGEIEGDRRIDLRRCERLPWIRVILETKLSDLCVWKEERGRKGSAQERIHIAVDNFSYLIVLVDQGSCFQLVTAFYIKRERQRLSKRKRYEAFIKKRGLRQNEPQALSTHGR